MFGQKWVGRPSGRTQYGRDDKCKYVSWLADDLNINNGLFVFISFLGRAEAVAQKQGPREWIRPMATVSHHLQHAMRPYSICHHQPPSASPLDGSTTAISSGTGGGLAKTIAVGVGGGGGTAVPTVPYFYPTTNQVSLSKLSSLPCPPPPFQLLSKCLFAQTNVSFCVVVGNRKEV